MVGLAGSIWVDGTDLHYISETGTERKATGSDSGSVAGLAGSIWIEGTQLAYIDSSQHKRILPYSTLSTVAGLNGSIWVGGDWIHYIVGGKETLWHTDTHTDTTVPHQDTAATNWTNYSNSHSDYQVSHNDTVHADWTNYSNYYPWSDSNHSNTTFPTGYVVPTWHTNYAVSSGGVHVDAWYHADQPDFVYYTNHEDQATHTDGTSTASPPHANGWTYQINEYTNWTDHMDVTNAAHQNTAHADWANYSNSHQDVTNAAHQDTAHADWANYSNTHADVTNAAHQDTAHSDHTDHSDVAHVDTPV